MAQLPGNSFQPPGLHRRHPDPPWLWLALMGGSVVVHCLLIAGSLPFLDRMATPPVEEASIPLDFVELPPESSSITAAPAPNASTNDSTSSASNSTSITPPVPAASANPPPLAPAPDAIGLTGASPVEPEPVIPEPIVPEPIAPIVNPEVVPPSPEPTNEPFIEPSNQLPNLTPANPELPPATPPVPPGPTPGNLASPLPSAIPSASATPPGFATSQINVPIPDVSETIALPDSTVDPNSLAQAGVNQTATPLQLMANLTIDRFTEAEDNPETIATPVDDTVSQEISDPTTSSCLSALQPTVLPALGTAVILQVSTDASGQVTQTTVQQSSQNAAYDALAQCAVEHWEFNPATDQGEPVASNALQVTITIDPK